ncbi:MAG TPA: DUF6600 domain-containing protein, partial [Candidatus Dormibacteraeota bacterium]|nr:DUF6600 domain-containing protein [Candidatus Dormibacteraeota bacterium]
MNRLQWLQGALPTRRLWHAMAAAVALLTAAAAAASADVDEKTLHLTPARVGYVEGDVSFWRPGAGDWEAATVNIPLAPGDALATRDGRFEVQVGPQAFLRAADQTQLRVKSQEPDFVQLEVTQGSAVLDLHQLPAGHVVEIDTPQGAMTANRDGFYRVDVDADSTRLTVRRAGTAALTPPGGQPIQVATGESVTVSGGAVGQLNLVAAPAFDDWDRWNYGRADSVLAAPRSYAVSTDIYGAADLDRYGSWRYAPTYGRVWVPSSVPVGWAPYTSGRWLWDPIYGYSWVDYAPWGWAPFHYGRWVYSGYWAWAPGPVVFGAVYAPALVSFFTPALSVSIGVGFPFVGWTALSWGEPLVPWWGGVGFVGVPCWHGWGGPHIVNNIVINNGDTVNANQINVYRNAKVPGGLVGVPKDHFGGTDVQRVRLAALTNNDVKPLHGAMPASFGTTPGGAHAVPKGSLPALSPGRAATQSGGAGGATEFTRQGPATTGGPGTSAAPPKSGAQTAPFDRLRSGTGSAAAGGSGGATELSRQAPPTTGGLGASAAPPKPGTQRAPFDRLRSSTVEAAREPLPKQALPSVGARTTTGNVAAPPPLRGMSKPQGGSVDAYRHLRSGAPRASGTAVAPTYPRGIQHAPVAKSAPPSLRPHSAAPAGGGNWNRAAQPAVPAPPKARSLARAESAPMANFAPQPKPLSMPSMNSAPSGGGSLGGGGLGGG